MPRAVENLVFPGLPRLLWKQKARGTFTEEAENIKEQGFRDHRGKSVWFRGERSGRVGHTEEAESSDLRGGFVCFSKCG